MEDANDETPQFVHSFSSASIPDSAKSGDFVTLMSVIDKVRRRRRGRYLNMIIFRIRYLPFPRELDYCTL